MTDLEISKALALAIGWKDVGISGVVDNAACVRDEYDWWRTFDYRDWTIAGPVAEQYGCFPIKTTIATRGDWVSLFGRQYHYADTPQKAIALAVIAGAK